MELQWWSSRVFLASRCLGAYMGTWSMYHQASSVKPPLRTYIRAAKFIIYHAEHSSASTLACPFSLFRKSLAGFKTRRFTELLVSHHRRLCSVSSLKSCAGTKAEQPSKRTYYLMLSMFRVLMLPVGRDWNSVLSRSIFRYIFHSISKYPAHDSFLEQMKIGMNEFVSIYIPPKQKCIEKGNKL